MNNIFPWTIGKPNSASQNSKALPDLQESGQDPAWSGVRASHAIGQSIWKGNKIALGITAWAGRLCLDGHVLGLQGAVRDCRSYVLAQKPCPMQSKCRFGTRPQPLTSFCLHNFRVTKAIDNYPYINLSPSCTEVIFTFPFLPFSFELEDRDISFYN